jgi:hypothetical protein
MTHRWTRFNSKKRLFEDARSVDRLCCRSKRHMLRRGLNCLDCLKSYNFYPLILENTETR